MEFANSLIGNTRTLRVRRSSCSQEPLRARWMSCRLLASLSCYESEESSQFSLVERELLVDERSNVITPV